MRAVIYARYSSDLQSEASIDDQVHNCRSRIDAEGWELIDTYSDHAVSGASTLRIGYQQLLMDARAGLIDVIVAEALDRLSRDQEDIAALYKQLTFAGVKLITLAEGEINELHVGLKGTIVKPYVKRGKTDPGDAEAICEAVRRPTMRFVAVKSPERQSALAVHRTRDLLIRQRTQLVNMMRAQLAEFGIALPKGIQHALRLVGQLVDGEALDIPSLANKVLIALAQQVCDLQVRIQDLDIMLMTWFRGNEVARRLETIPGIGIVTASALAATVTDAHQFTSARQFAAWLGLTPRANSSGGKERLGRISKMGDQYKPPFLTC